jgi:hypothetical protein
MADPLYTKFVQRWQEVTDLPPQRIGRFTPAYKLIVSKLKVMPWPVLLSGSVLTVIGLYFVLGTAITFLVSLLQRGF